MSRKAPLFRLFKRKYLPQKNLSIITFEGIAKFLKEILYEDFKPNFLVGLEKFLDLDQMLFFLVNKKKLKKLKSLKLSFFRKTLKKFAQATSLGQKWMKKNF